MADNVPLVTAFDLIPGNEAAVISEAGRVRVSRTATGLQMSVDGAAVEPINGGGGGTVDTDATLVGDGSGGDPLGVNPAGDIAVNSLAATVGVTAAGVGATTANTSLTTPLIFANATGGGTAQSAFECRTNGTPSARMRGDAVGGAAFVAMGPSWNMLSGGDYGVGQINLTGFTNGNIVARAWGVGGIPVDLGMLMAVSGGRFGQSKGADVGSASTLTLGADGNLFHITGTNTINYMTFTNWIDGSRVLLYFASALILTHNAGSVPANTYALDLQGDVDASMPAGSMIELARDTALTKWFEVTRRGA